MRPLDTSALRKMGVPHGQVRTLRQAWGNPVELNMANCRAHSDVGDWSRLALVFFQGIRLGEYLSGEAQSLVVMGEGVLAAQEEFHFKLSEAIKGAANTHAEAKQRFIQSLVTSRQKAENTEKDVPGPRGKRGGRGQQKNETRGTTSGFLEGVSKDTVGLKSQIKQLVQQLKHTIDQEKSQHNLRLATVFGRLVEELP